MNEYDNKIDQYIIEKNIILERMIFEEEIKTSEESCKYTGASAYSNVKTILFLSKEDKEIYSVIARCRDKVDIKKLQKKYNKKMYFMPGADVEKYTGYPVGGVPPFGYDAKFILNSDLRDVEQVYAGGGTVKSIIKISIKELKRITLPDIMDVVIKQCN